MLLLFVGPFAFGLANYLVPLQIGAQGHGVPAPQRPRLLALPVRRHHDARRLPHARTAPPSSAGTATRRCPTASARRASAATCGSSASRSLGRVRRPHRASTSSPPCRPCGRPGMTMFRMPIFTWNMLRHEPARPDDVPGAHRGRGDAVRRPPLRRPHLRRQPRRRTRSCGSTCSGSSATPRCTSSCCRSSACSPRSSPCSPAGRCSATRRSSSPRWPSASCRVGVWAHHMFTTGAVLLPFFSVHDDAHRRADRREVLQLDRHDVGRHAERRSMPLVWGIGFLLTFLIGGLTGVMLASAAARLPPVATRTSSSPTSTTCCSAARCSACSPPSTTGSRSSPAGCCDERLGLDPLLADVRRAST